MKRREVDRAIDNAECYTLDLIRAVRELMDEVDELHAEVARLETQLSQKEV